MLYLADRDKGEKMKTSDFYYDLPEELIAQDPLADRSASRLLHLDRETGEIEHTDFKHITRRSAISSLI